MKTPVTQNNPMIANLWFNGNESEWLKAEKDYWMLVLDKNLDLEKCIENLDSSEVEKMDANNFLSWLEKSYYVWKFTDCRFDPRKHLKKYNDNEEMKSLEQIKKKLFSFDLSDIAKGLNIATAIYGLGIPGASGLLAVLFPEYFGTVDQFAVKALQKIEGYQSHDILKGMKPQSLSKKNAIILIQLFRNKADELNSRFQTDYWTPRKIDKVLWSIERKKR